MADISFNIDPEVIIGTDTINRAGTICKAYGNRVVIAAEKTPQESKIVERLVSILEDSGVEAILFDDIPALAMADTAGTLAALASVSRCSGIIGLGSPAVQMVARAAAIITNAEIDIFDLLDGKNPGRTSLPYIAIPSVKEDPFLFSDDFIVVDPRDKAIKLIKTPVGVCKAVIIDNDFSETNIGTIFDGFLMAIESYCSKKANFLSEPLLEEAVGFYAKLILDENADPDMSVKAAFLASLGAGTSSAGVGSALSLCIASRFPVSKPLCSIAILPALLEKLQSARPEKMAKIAFLMGENTKGLSVAETAALPLTSIQSSMKKLNSLSLQKLGLNIDRLVPVAEVVRDLDFAAFSPWTATLEEILGLIKQSF